MWNHFIALWRAKHYTLSNVPSFHSIQFHRLHCSKYQSGLVPSGTKTSVTHGHDYFQAMILILLVLCTTSCSSELRFCDTKVICFIIVSLLGKLYVFHTKVDKNQFSAVLVGAALNIAIVTLGWEFAFGPILDHLKLIGWNWMTNKMINESIVCLLWRWLP